MFNSLTVLNISYSFTNLDYSNKLKQPITLPSGFSWSFCCMSCHGVFLLEDFRMLLFVSSLLILWLKILCLLAINTVITCLFRDERDIIEHYFWEGFKYKTILQFLKEYHDIHMSYSTFRRRLYDYNLRRRSHHSSPTDIWNIIRQELQGPGT